MTKETVKRMTIYQYIKSGKLVAVSSGSRYSKYKVLDMSPDLRKIKKIRLVNYIKRSSLTSTNYILEVIENIEKIDNENNSFSYQFIRVLTKEDIDIEKWKNTDSLTELPVGSHSYISKEEKLWAGEREGNIGNGITLSLVMFFSWWILYITIKNDSSILFAAFIALILTLFCIAFKWRASKPANPEKLEQLIAHKRQLRADTHLKQEQAKTKTEKMLENYSNWEQLTPLQFEHALVYTLKNHGYDLQVTQYVGDGGIDLEGINELDESVIVQAKKYSSSIGVAVVREMIGVRESHPKRPITIIVALNGFTRGAKQLAKQQNVTLMSIKELILGI